MTEASELGLVVTDEEHEVICANAAAAAADGEIVALTELGKMLDR